MNNFFEVTKLDGLKVMVNARHIEMVCEAEDGSCTIYFAYDGPNYCDQDYITPKENYNRVKELIWR